MVVPEAILIAVAPNGARKTKADHPHLPVTTRELVDTALSCAEAGAGMIHFHIRDHKGRHTLDSELYQQTLAELDSAIGDRLLLQVTSEAAGIYTQPKQLELMRRLAPHCLSCGLREFIRSEEDLDSAASFFQELYNSGALIQYILYSPAEVAWFVDLCEQGIVPGSRHFLLFVFGSYGQPNDAPTASLDQYLSPLKKHQFPYSWMVCGFDQHEFEVAEAAAARGGHLRVGFENNCFRADGSPASSNSVQVDQMVALALRHDRSPADKAFAVSLHR